MSGATLGLIGTLGGGFLVFASTVIGFYVKSKADKQAAIDKAAQEKADREDAARRANDELVTKRSQENYDNMQADLAANRAEIRSLQTDLGQARTDMGKLWSEMATMRRAFEAAEAHIADIHRWDDGGRVGPIPPRGQG